MKESTVKRFEAETEEIRKEYESVMEQKIQKEAKLHCIRSRFRIWRENKKRLKSE